MNLRSLLITAALLVCLSVPAVADLSPTLVEWGTGPYQFLLTKEEAATWKSLKNDDQAKAFVALFWARRDPTPATPSNEYKRDIDGRIVYADTNFTGEKTRGALTDRGKTILLYGPPTRATRASNNPNFTPTQWDRDQPPSAIIWQYEDATAKTIFGVTKPEVRFTDRMGNQIFKYERTNIDLIKAQQKAIEWSIKQPALSVAPDFRAVATAAAEPSAPEAAVVVTQLTNDVLKTAVAELKAAAKNPLEGKAHVAWGEYVTTEGQYFVPVLLFVPGASGITAAESTFFGVVENEAGEQVLAFEQAGPLEPVKDDFYADRSLALPAGKHRGYFGLAQDGKVVALTAADLTLAGTLDKDATGVSQLILARDIFPLPVAQLPTDPFAFGGLKVVPRADRTYRKSDELLYFAELRNPGIGEPALPADGSVPLNPVAPEPRIQVKVDVETTNAAGKKIIRSAPLTEMQTMQLKGLPGRYGIGTGIPLSGFQTGNYTFTIKIIDTLKKQSYTLTDKFTIVE